MNGKEVECTYMLEEGQAADTAACTFYIVHTW